MDKDKFVRYGGVGLSIFLIVLGIYVGVKHHKEQGFWWGVLALFLIGGLHVSTRVAEVKAV
jgi:hypothetical protein